MADREHRLTDLEKQAAKRFCSEQQQIVLNAHWKSEYNERGEWSPRAPRSGADFAKEAGVDSTKRGPRDQAANHLRRAQEVLVAATVLTAATKGADGKVIACLTSARFGLRRPFRGEVMRLFDHLAIGTKTGDGSRKRKTGFKGILETAAIALNQTVSQIQAGAAGPHGPRRVEGNIMLMYFAVRYLRESALPALKTIWKESVAREIPPIARHLRTMLAHAGDDAELIDFYGLKKEEPENSIDADAASVSPYFETLDRSGRLYDGTSSCRSLIRVLTFGPIGKNAAQGQRLRKFVLEYVSFGLNSPAYQSTGLRLMLLAVGRRPRSTPRNCC